MARLADLEVRIARVEAKCEAYKPLSGINANVSDAVGGTGRTIDVTPGLGGGGGGTGNNIWAPVVAGDDGDEVGISENHPILNSLTVNDSVKVVDIDSSFTIAEGDVLYLKIDYSAPGVISDVTLVGGAQWTDYPAPFATTGGGTLEDPDIVVSSYYLLAYGAALDDAVGLVSEGPIVDGVKIVRCCYAPLRIDEVNTGDGFVILYPLPPSYPGPAVPP